MRVSVSFTDTNGVLTDPGAVSVAAQKPDGTTLTPAPTATKDAVGKYHADIDTTGLAGVWHYWFSGTTPLQAVADGTFNVKWPNF